VRLTGAGVALIGGAYVNAWGIVDALARVGFPGRVVCLKPRGVGPVLVERRRPRVEVWEVDLRRPADLPNLVAARLPGPSPCHVFLTDERFHEAFAEAAGRPALAHVRAWVGAPGALPTILDRYAFCRFVEDGGLGHVPRTIPGDADPFAAFDGSFFFRYRRTWEGLAKLPRVRRVETRADLRALVGEARARGDDEGAWCYQEILSVDAAHNVSVCGWHGPDARHYVVTRKVWQHPPGTGNGDVVEVVDDRWGLSGTARGLLDALAYEGPFELEFVRDKAAERYLMIELNPRFWMQHGLVEALTGDALVRRALGLPLAPPPAGAPTPRYWVNTIYATYRLLQGQLGLLPLLRPPSVLAPPPAVVPSWLPRLALSRVLGRWRRLVGRAP